MLWSRESTNDRFWLCGVCVRCSTSASRHSFTLTFIPLTCRSHAFWVPVAGTFKKEGNTFEFEAVQQGAGFAGPVSSDVRVTFTGTVNPVTFVKK